MSESVQYFAIVDTGDSIDDPSGIVRRVHVSEGKLDESLQADLRWHRSSAIREWDRAEGRPLVEVTPEQAERIIARFKELWRDLPES